MTTSTTSPTLNDMLPPVVTQMVTAMLDAREAGRPQDGPTRYDLQLFLCTQLPWGQRDDTADYLIRNERLARGYVPGQRDAAGYLL